MKAKLVIFLILMFVIISFSGCNRVVDSDLEIDSKPTISSAENEESIAEKLSHEIDGAYREEQNKPEYTTTIGMIELADKYTKKWAQIADDYYNKIMDSAKISKDYKNNVFNMKINWEKDSEKQYSDYVANLQATYSGGTIIGPLAANYKYEMQKKWALQLVEMYDKEINK